MYSVIKNEIPLIVMAVYEKNFLRKLCKLVQIHKSQQQRLLIHWNFNKTEGQGTGKKIVRYNEVSFTLGARGFSCAVYGLGQVLKSVSAADETKVPVARKKKPPVPRVGFIISSFFSI